jgi:predicted MFS family arabinose efflux permease
MNGVSRSEQHRPGADEQRSTRAAFFVAGFGIAAWAPLVPYAKQRLGADEATLGMLLLCLGAGSLITMPISGALATRFGCRRVIWTASLCSCASLSALAWAPTPFALAAALLVFGAGIGGIDVTANIQAVIVEQAAGKPMMSGFHGLFSGGGIAGAAAVSGLLEAGASPLLATLAVDAAILVLLLAFGRHLLPYGAVGDSAFFALPRGIVLLIGGLCFITFLAEGAMLDWSAVFLTSLRAVEPAHAGAGYAAFSIAMTGGRLLGDRVVHALGGPTVLLAGGLAAAAGLALTVIVPSWAAAFLGFALVGLGASNIVPVLYSALGRQQVMPANLAVSAVTTLGYLGILAGPALIGFVAQATSLSAALLCVAGMLLVVAACARIARP